MRLVGNTLLLILLATGTAAGQTVATEADRLADLETLETDLVRSDPSFDEAARNRALARLDSLRARVAVLSDAEFELGIAEVAAGSGNGHTQLLPARWAADFPQSGVRYLITDDGLHVAQAAPEWSDLVGRRVERVEGWTLDSLRTLWDRFANGRRGHRDQSLTVFLEAPAMLHAAGVSTSPEIVTLTMADGREVAVGISGAWAKPTGIWYYLTQSRLLELAKAGAVSGDPLYLQDPDAFFRLVPLPEIDGAYLQLRANVDFTRRTNLAAEARSAIEALRRLEPRHVIVDLRFDLGGDLNTTRDLMEAIPGLVAPDGRIFAITSGRTFSAGISSLGYLQQAAGGEVTIVGSPVGDELEFWAEGEPLRLRSGAIVGRATERHDYRTGCQEDDCHRSIRIHPIRVDTLEPTVRPDFTYADFVAGRDPYLDAVLGLIDGGAPD